MFRVLFQCKIQFAIIALSRCLPTMLAQWLQSSLLLCCVGGGWTFVRLPNFLCSCRRGLGNKERQWPTPKPVQVILHGFYQVLSGLSARSICQSVPLIFPLHFFPIEMQIWQCGSKTTNQGFFWDHTKPSSDWSQELRVWVAGQFWCSPGVTPLLTELAAS